MSKPHLWQERGALVETQLNWAEPYTYSRHFDALGFPGLA